MQMDKLGNAKADADDGACAWSAFPAYKRIETYVATTSVDNGGSLMAIREDHGTGGFDCILRQFIYRFGKMRTQRKDELESQGYKVDTASGKDDVFNRVVTWLRGEGKIKEYVPPYQRKGINCDLQENSATRSATASSAKSAPESVEKFCVRRYGIPVDEYADIVIGKKDRPVEAAKFDFELAIFAFSQNYDQTRVSLLCPREKDQKKVWWKIWDSDGLKPGFRKVHLTVGDLGDRQYLSLVDRADAHVFADNANDHATDEDSGVSSKCAFAECELCKKVRLFPEKAIKHCKNSDMRFEGTPGGHNEDDGCKDVAILSMIRDFYRKKKEGKKTTRDYIEEFDDVEFPRNNDNRKTRVLNLTYLFLAVQAVGKIEVLRDRRKMSKLALVLRLRLGNASDTLIRFYEDIFLKPQRGNHGDHLENFLRSKPEVLKAISDCQSLILRDLELKDQFSLQISAPQPLIPSALPGLFRDRAPAEQSEDLARVMRELIQNANIWLQVAEGNHLPGWKDAVESLARKAQSLVHSHEIRQNNLVMLGNNGVGKSFLMDILLRVSESDRTTYSLMSPDDEAESRLLQQERFRLAAAGKMLVSQLRDATNSASGQASVGKGGTFDNGGGAGQDEKEEDSVARFHFEKFSKTSLDECITDSDIEMERRHAKHIAESHRDESGSLMCKGTSTSFLLPWGKISGSTTRCSISVRRAPQYQVVLEYRTLSEIALEWTQFQELATKLADKSLDRISEEYRDYSEKQKRIVLEVQEAKGGIETVTDKDARTYLSSFKTEQLDVLQPLSEVVKSEILCFVGEGPSALHDRMLIRSIVHHCQGMEDPVLGNKSPTKIFKSWKKEDDSVFNPSEFGKRTGFALKRITIFAPCELAPLRDSEWIDTAGSGDSNLIKKKVLKDALGQASSAIVISAKNLSTDAQTMEALAQTSAMEAIMRQLIEDPQKIPQGKVSVIQNYERSFRADYSRPPSLQDLKGDGFKGKDGSIANTKGALREVAENVVEESFPAVEQQTLLEILDNFDTNQPVNILIPAPATAVSLIMTDSLSGSDRQEWLEETQMLELFGTVEVFLRGETHAVFDEFLPCLEINLAKLTKLEDTPEETKPTVTVPRQFLAEAQKRLQNRAKTADIMATFKTELDDTFTIFDCLSTRNLAGLQAALRRCLRKKSGDKYTMIKLDMDSENGEIDTISKRIKEFTSHGSKRFKDALKIKGTIPDGPLTKFAKIKISNIFDVSSEFNNKVSAEAVARNDFVYDSLYGGLKEMIETAMELVCTKPILELAGSEAEELIKIVKYNPEASVKLRREVEEHAKEQLSQHKEILVKTVVRQVRAEVSAILDNAKAKLLAALDGVSAQQFLDGDYLIRYLCDVLLELIHSIRQQFTLTKPSKQRWIMTAYDEFVCNLGIRPPLKRILWYSRNTKTFLWSICDYIQTKLWVPTALFFLDSQKTQIAVARADFEKLRIWVKDSRKRLGATEGQDLKQIGRRLSDNFRRMRVMERYADDSPEAQAALPARATSDYADFTKQCQGGGSKGYIDYDPLVHANLFKECNVKEVIESRKFLQKLQHLKCDFKHSLQELVRSSDPAAEDPTVTCNVLLSWYCRHILGMHEDDSTDPAVTHQLRKRIQWQSLDSLHTSFPAGTNFQDLNEFSEHIIQENTYPDFLSMALLACYHERPINVYVPWDPERPIRISPQIERYIGTGSKSSTEFVHTDGADAVAFVGYRTKGAKKVPLFVPCSKPRLTRQRSHRDHLYGGGGSGEGARELNSGGAGKGEAEGAGEMDVVEENIQDMENGSVTPGMSRSVSPTHALDIADESDVSAYTLVTFAASEWQEHTTNGKQMYSRQDLTYGQEKFEKLSAQYLQFSERYVFMRAKPKNTRNYLEIPGDDAFAHGDNFMGVFDGVGEGGYDSGHMARTLATESISSSRDVTSQIDNRSYEILRIAHENSIESIRAEYLGRTFIGSSTASIVSLIKKSDKFELHCAWHGDSQIVVMGRGPDYKPKFVSVRAFYHLVTEEELTLKCGTIVRLKKDFMGLEMGVERKVINSDVRGYQIDEKFGGIFVAKVGWNEYLKPLYNPAPTQLRISGSVSVPPPGQHKMSVEDGDIVLLASDGLYDNILKDTHDKSSWNQKTDKEHEEKYATELGKEIAKIFTLHHKEFERSHDPQMNLLRYIGDKLSGRAVETMETDRGKKDDLTVMISQINRGQVETEQHAPTTNLFGPENRNRKALCADMNMGISMYCTSFASAAPQTGGVSSASVASRIRGTH